MSRQVLFFSLLLSVFCFFPAFSAGGALADSSAPLHVIRTEYFDIIFPEECKESAKKIESVCDDYYLEITKLLETEAYQRFPVTITRSVEVLNAYYAAIPYNRIVLYDTLPETSLDMYEETIQSVFYHELTHAVTYNMKSDTLKKLSFFADCLNPAWFSVTTFWAEGATVSFESKGRGGRLNDPFSTQMVNQSVSEGHFPSWRDVTGARDTYPGGTDAYMFGSMFAAYLQETYGMSKYADFWKNAGSSLTWSFIAGVFEKTYGMKITDAWNDFEKTLALDHAEKSAEVLSHKKARITSFDAYFDSEHAEVKIAYFDAASSSLRLLTLDTEGKIKKNKKLLAITGITRVLFSPDGKKLALSRTIDKKNYKCVTAEFDIDKKKYAEHKETRKRDGYFKINGKNAEFADILMKNYLEKSEIPFSPIGIDENLNATIVKNGLSWRIRFFDEENALFEYDFSNMAGKNLILHELHKVSCDSESILLSFSWAELGKGGKMLSRTGLLKINRKSKDAVCFLQKENAFAGVLEAIPEKIEEDSFFFYILAAEYEQTPLYRVELKTSDFEKVRLKASKKPQIKKETTDYTDSTDEKKKPQITQMGGDSNKNPSVRNSSTLSYNPFRYYKRGIILPGLSVIPVYSLDFTQNSTALLGATFVSTNPWGDRQIAFSAGYDLAYETGGALLSFSGGDDSFQYTVSGTSLFDKDGFMQTAETLQLIKTLWRGKVSAFLAGTQGNFLYGRQLIPDEETDEDDEIQDNWDDSVGKSADALAFMQFTNMHKIAPHVYSVAGFTLQPFVLGSYRTSENLKKFSIEDKYVNAGAQVQVRLPIIVPFIFTATLFPSSKYAASGSVKAILFDFEIHKGIPAVSLFAQRVVLSASYSGKISYNYRAYGEQWNIRHTDEIFKNAKKEDYSDAVQLGAELYLSPNTGFAATGDIQFSLGYALIYRPNPKKTEKRVAYGITAAFNY